MLEAREISFAYPGNKDLLYDKFSLSLSPGERVALQAPSGFGKTTLCKLLAGFERPRTGKILCDGSPVPERGVCPVQMIGQHPELVVDPRMRMQATLEEAGTLEQALLESLGIRPAWLNRFPHELSGGELQRFCIARALMAQPRYIVADEISTMLDAVTQAHIWNMLLRWTEEHGSGLVFVSHSPALSKRIATRIVDLNQNAAADTSE